MQVAVMVRSLSNKYVPVPSLDEIEIDLQASLKDFRHRCRKRAAAIALREHTDPPSSQLQTPPMEASQSTERSDADSWREPVQPDPPLDEDRWGFGTNLYDTISAHPEVPSNHNRLEHFLDKLENEFATVLRSLRKKDT